MKVRVTRKSVSMVVDGKDVSYKVGDEFEATERLFKAFKDRLELVETEGKKAPKGKKDADKDNGNGAGQA